MLDPVATAPGSVFVDPRLNTVSLPSVTECSRERFVQASVGAIDFGDYFLKRAYYRSALIIAKQYFNAALRLTETLLALPR
jgi:hypothetical protein